MRKEKWSRVVASVVKKRECRERRCSSNLHLDTAEKAREKGR
jgi:hypothetical protein